MKMYWPDVYLKECTEDGNLLITFKPNINMHVLLTVLRIFLKVLVGRMSLNIETFCL